MLCLNWKLRSWIGTFASLVECKLKCEFIECLFQFAWNHFFLAKAFLRHFFIHRSHRSANCCRVFDAAFSRSLLAYRTYNSKQTDKQPNLFAQIPTTFFHCRFSGLWHIECDIFSTPFKSQCSIFFCSLLILPGLHPRIMAAANRCSCQMDLCANIPPCCIQPFYTCIHFLCDMERSFVFGLYGAHWCRRRSNPNGKCESVRIFLARKRDSSVWFQFSFFMFAEMCQVMTSFLLFPHSFTRTALVRLMEMCEGAQSIRFRDGKRWKKKEKHRIP